MTVRIKYNFELFQNLRIHHFWKLNKRRRSVYLSSMIQPLLVNVKVKVITLFLVMVGAFISPTFAQQFKEPNYVIRGGEVLGFAIDQETTSLIILLKPKSGGELIITLPRNLIDAKIDSVDSDFTILVDNLGYLFYDETTSSFDRTVTIPFQKFNSEIKIIGTHVFSQRSTLSTADPQQPIDDKIQSELKSEIPDGQAKLLILSDTQWSGALQASGFDYTELSGQHHRTIIFGCETSIFRGGIFAAKIQKITEDGYVKIVVIQNQRILAQGLTEAQFGEVIINGDCDSNGPRGGGCLIATATFGSELAPQVQELRELRDNTLLQTSSGSTFMDGFNSFYYSFSPTIADWERQNPVFKEAVKITITPLLTSLSILNYVDMDSEAKVLGYGISLILLNIGMYFVAPAFLITRLNKKLKGF